MNSSRFGRFKVTSSAPRVRVYPRDEKDYKSLCAELGKEAELERRRSHTLYSEEEMDKARQEFLNRQKVNNV